MHVLKSAPWHYLNPWYQYVGACCASPHPGIPGCWWLSLSLALNNDIANTILFVCWMNECYISESHGQFVVNTWSAGLDDEMVKWKQRLLLQRGMVMHKAWLWSPMRGVIFSHAWQAETSGGAWQPSVCLYVCVCVCVYETDTKQMCSDIPLHITFCWHKNFILIHPSYNLMFLQNLEYLAYAECS